MDGRYTDTLRSGYNLDVIRK